MSNSSVHLYSILGDMYSPQELGDQQPKTLLYHALESASAQTTEEYASEDRFNRHNPTLLFKSFEKSQIALLASRMLASENTLSEASEAYSVVESTNVPPSPESALNERVQASWVSWIVHVIRTYDGMCAAIVRLVSDFFYREFEFYHQEFDYQRELEAWSHQAIDGRPAEIYELRLPRPHYQPPGPVEYDPIYLERSEYLRSLLSFQTEHNNAKSALDTAQRSYNYFHKLITTIVQNHEGRPAMLQKLMNELQIDPR